MDDIRPFREDIDPLLALIENPAALRRAFQAIHAYRVRMQELLEVGKRAEAVRTVARCGSIVSPASQRRRHERSLLMTWLSSARSWRGSCTKQWRRKDDG